MVEDMVYWESRRGTAVRDCPLRHPIGDAKSAGWELTNRPALALVQLPLDLVVKPLGLLV